jgi:osmotically-inducible protein OsmY
MVANDRRTTGAQVEDQVIEGKARDVVNAFLGDRAHVNVTSYNAMVLLTGEVPTAADKGMIEKSVGQIEHVRSIVNDLAVMPNTSMSNRSSDSVITGRVKAEFVGASDLSANAIKVVTERSVVYLMGRVTETEAKRAAELTRSVSGVQKVVRVFEIISATDATAMQPAAPASAPAATQ